MFSSQVRDVFCCLPALTSTASISETTLVSLFTARENQCVKPTFLVRLTALSMTLHFRSYLHTHSTFLQFITGVWSQQEVCLSTTIVIGVMLMLAFSSAPKQLSGSSCRAGAACNSS
eukprot:GHRQ01030309.1.p1 GENE.GHRQ01030309.1~~GHRQ01030309.1.p1  ORF type:complete len:117 (+),score=2.14 GHRQ01030309.1:38-388(+)